MTFKQAVAKCTGLNDVVATRCTTREEWDALVLLIHTDRSPSCKFGEFDNSDTFYFIPLIKSYGHYPRNSLEEETRGFYEFSLKPPVSILLKYIRSIDE